METSAAPHDDIRLAPSGTLVLGDGAPGDWREHLFRLGAGPDPAGGSPSIRFWHGVGRRFLDHFQRTAAEFWTLEEFEGTTEAPEKFILPEPPGDLLPGLVESAPPLPGGEYLAGGLPRVWSALGDWLAEALKNSPSPAGFLAAYAPQWTKVGRVYFHLAENKADPDYPFAFLPTYTVGLAPGGRPLHKPLGEALRQYSASRDKPALRRLLTPVGAAAKARPWVDEMVESRRVYQATPFTPREAWTFLKDIPALEAAGLRTRIPDWWRRRPQAQVKIVLDPERSAKLGAASLLEFDRRLVLGDEELTEAEFRELMDGEGGLMLLKGRWVEVDRERLQQALDHWESLKAEFRSGSLSFSEGLRLLAGVPGRLGGDEIPDGEDGVLRIVPGEKLAALLAGMRQAPEAGGRLPKELAGLRKRLSPYQRKGADWLLFMSSLGLGACLADDMGLGKTIQVLTLLTHLKHREPQAGPSLLVLPASLLGNWKAEAEKFAPGLRLRFLHRALDNGRARDRSAADVRADLADCDMAVTTYGLLTRQEFLKDIEWNLVIADEAQAVKNPGARQTKALKALKAKARLALTGTPVENRLGALWSLFDFLNPGLLGTSGEFGRYGARLAKAGDAAAYAPLRRLVSPYLLRRLKTDRDIVPDLPDKVESLSFCQLTKKQTVLYQQTVERLAEALDSADGLARRGLILQTIMRLKQIVNHPDQLTGAGIYAAKDSGKFERLGEICAKLAERQERALIFTQFREIIDPLSDFLAGIYGRPGLVLHGGTRTAERQQLVEAFQRDDGPPPFFLLSLKAGGVGLNLTAAARVIHFDRWWNPAVENQATDRAFRIGQTRNVMVHKFVCSGIVEEKIHQIIEEKRGLADRLVCGDGQIDLTSLDDAAVLDLVRLDLGDV